MTTMPTPLLRPRHDESLIPAQPQRPSLQVIPGTKSASRRIMLLSIAVFSLALVAALGLNVALAQGSWDLKMAQLDAKKLADYEQVRAEQLAEVTAPGALCASARELGMVPAESIRYLRLSDGAILGDRTVPVAQSSTSGGVCSPAAVAPTVPNGG